MCVCVCVSTRHEPRDKGLSWESLSFRYRMSECGTYVSFTDIKPGTVYTEQIYSRAGRGTLGVAFIPETSIVRLWKKRDKGKRFAGVVVVMRGTGRG